MGPWVKVWNSNNFNPDDYLPKTTPNVNGGIIINGETTVGYRPYLKFHIPGVNYSQFVMDENGTVHLLNGSEQTPRTYKPLKAGPIFSNGNRVLDSGNFNPDSKLNYSEFGGDLDTISTSGMYRLLSGCTNIPLGSSQGCFLLHTNWDANAAQQMYFVYSTTDIYIRNKVGGTWKPWQKVWNAGNFNPDSKFPYLGMGGVNDNSNEIGAGYSGSSAGGNFNGPFIKFGQTSNYMTELYNRHDQDAFQIRRMVNGEWQPFVSLWHSGNLGNATTSKAGLMSAADKTKLDGLSGGGLNIPASGEVAISGWTYNGKQVYAQRWTGEFTGVTKNLTTIEGLSAILMKGGTLFLYGSQSNSVGLGSSQWNQTTGDITRISDLQYNLSTGSVTVAAWYGGTSSPTTVNWSYEVWAAYTK